MISDADSTLPVKSRSPTYQRHIARTRMRTREQPQRWDWAPEREVVVGRTGNRLEDVLERVTRESSPELAEAEHQQFVAMLALDDLSGQARAAAAALEAAQAETERSIV
jgi:hypothetical protein